MTPRLIVADDSAEMRTIVRRALQPEFPECFEAQDCRELFWQLLRVSIGPARPVVVVADVRMPGYANDAARTGIDVLAAWRDDAEPVPLIVITSYPDDDVVARTAAIGATLLAKPFTRAALRGAVASALRTTRSA